MLLPSWCSLLSNLVRAATRFLILFFCVFLPASFQKIFSQSSKPHTHSQRNGLEEVLLPAEKNLVKELVEESPAVDVCR